jgi:hypothetical protein
MFAQQSDALPAHSTSTTPARSRAPTSETSPLLGARSVLIPHQHSTRSTSPSRSPPNTRLRATWHDTLTARSLKKKTSALSDRISGRNHSSANLWALGLGQHEESTEEEDDDEEDRVGGVGGLRRRKGSKGVKGVGYDGEFSAELEGELGNGLRMWAGECCRTADRVDRILMTLILLLNFERQLHRD